MYTISQYGIIRLSLRSHRNSLDHSDALDFVELAPCFLELQSGLLCPLSASRERDAVAVAQFLHRDRASGMDARLLLVRFSQPDALLSQDAHIQRGGLFVPTPTPPPSPLAELQVRICSPLGDDIELAATVVHVAAGAGLALAFTDARSARDSLAPLLEAARLAPKTQETDGVQVRWDETMPAAAKDDAGGALVDRIRAMSANERMQLAMHGGRAERQILMRDINKVIHSFVIKNPRITIDEVRYIAGFRQTNPEVLKTIADNPDWGQNPTILSALVSNPKTPSLVVRKIFDRLPMSEVRRLARANDVPPLVSQLARKKAIGTE